MVNRYLMEYYIRMCHAPDQVSLHSTYATFIIVNHYNLFCPLTTFNVYIRKITVTYPLRHNILKYISI